MSSERYYSMGTVNSIVDRSLSWRSEGSELKSDRLLLLPPPYWALFYCSLLTALIDTTIPYRN